ncbi:MAG TPA: FeoA family protein [Verrucomicrobiae bacterium]|jgi:Fe2+ transport system protein FeoA|nr:FeoA family protein [Verrucomicrobiae bacterium]
MIESTMNTAVPDSADYTCPLSQVKQGAEVRIHQISTPPEVAQRLREIGFAEHRIIKLALRQSGLVCHVNNARLALSAELARLIIVQPLGAP